jgi:hypothetical protein
MVAELLTASQAFDGEPNLSTAGLVSQVTRYADLYPYFSFFFSVFLSYRVL